jgi:hypothetical protein
VDLAVRIDHRCGGIHPQARSSNFMP